MNPKPIAQAKNPLLAAALPALLRARQRAEEIAIATHTPLVQVIDGKMVRVYPQGDGKGGVAFTSSTRRSPGDPRHCAR
jgi:hypothetical protein